MENSENIHKQRSGRKMGESERIDGIQGGKNKNNNRGRF